MTTTIPEFIISEPSDIYHQQTDKYLSSSRLKVFRKSPVEYDQMQTGKIVTPDSPAFLVGRAAHTAILEGISVYNKQFCADPPINPKTRKSYGPSTNAYKDWVSTQTKEILSVEQGQLVANLTNGVQRNKYAKQLLSQGVAEGVVRANYCGKDCQIRIDFFNPEYGLIDLKTCDKLVNFEYAARKFMYPTQFAFYQRVFEAAGGDELPFYVIAVEKKAPYECGVWKVTDATLNLAAEKNERDIKEILLCEKRGVWPSRFAEVRDLEVI